MVEWKGWWNGEAGRKHGTRDYRRVKESAMRMRQLVRFAGRWMRRRETRGSSAEFRRRDTHQPRPIHFLKLGSVRSPPRIPDHATPPPPLAQSPSSDRYRPRRHRDGASRAPHPSNAQHPPHCGPGIPRRVQPRPVDRAARARPGAHPCELRRHRHRHHPSGGRHPGAASGGSVLLPAPPCLLPSACARQARR